MNLLKKLFPEMFAERPLSATLEGWDEWDAKAKAKWPFAYFVTYTVVGNVARFLSIKHRQFRDFKYWFLYRLHPEYKYHLVHTGLKPNYHEYDTRLIEAILFTNKDFVENAKQIVAWNLKEPSTKAFQNAYDWYTKDRPFLLAQLEAHDVEMDKELPKNISKKFSAYMKWLHTPEAANYVELRKSVEEGEKMIRAGNKKHAMAVLKYIEYMWY